MRKTESAAHLYPGLIILELQTDGKVTGRRVTHSEDTGIFKWINENEGDKISRNNHNNQNRELKYVWI